MKRWTSQLSLQRLLLYLACAALLPSLFIVLYYHQKKSSWEEVMQKVHEVDRLSSNYARAQALNRTVRQVYKETDQFYLENQLESLSFLKKERASLERLFKNQIFTGNESAERRFSFICSSANRLEWLQTAAQTFDGIQETEVHLSHPVEVDASDLREILNRIESHRKGSPQLVVTNFKLSKKAQANGNEVFELNLKLLKREFL